MTEYIEREAVVKLREEFWKDRCDYMAVRVTNIMNVPAADVVEVVRCKDCKYYKPQDKSKRWHGTKKYCCRAVVIKVDDNDFCSCGAKMDGKGETE